MAAKTGAESNFILRLNYHLVSISVGLVAGDCIIGMGLNSKHQVFKDRKGNRGGVNFSRFVHQTNTVVIKKCEIQHYYITLLH